MSLHIANVITFPGKCNSKTREFAMSEAASTLLANVSSHVGLSQHEAQCSL
jgi:hypothetical protein